MLRNHSSITNSHPNTLIKMIDNIINKDDDYILIDDLKEWINDYSIEKTNNQNILNIFNDYYANNETTISKDELYSTLVAIFKDSLVEETIKNINEYCLSQDIIYIEGKDKIDLVIDRDRQNFKEEQYDNVLDYCEKNNVNLYVSNPCFEFWILLHFDDIFDYDRKELFENRKVNSKKRYLEYILQTKIGYMKNDIKFDLLKDKIINAINNEKSFEENVVNLKHNLGSNVGLLVSELINK